MKPYVTPSEPRFREDSQVILDTYSAFTVHPQPIDPEKYVFLRDQESTLSRQQPPLSGM